MPLSVDPRAEKFNMITYAQVRFFRFQPEIRFWANLVKKIEIVSLSRNLVLRISRICRI